MEYLILTQTLLNLVVSVAIIMAFVLVFKKDISLPQIKRKEEKDNFTPEDKGVPLDKFVPDFDKPLKIVTKENPDGSSEIYESEEE